MHVARIARIPHRRDADLGLGHVGRLETGSVEHGLRCALRFRLSDMAAGFVELAISSVFSRPLIAVFSARSSVRGRNAVTCQDLYGFPTLENPRVPTHNVMAIGCGSSTGLFELVSVGEAYLRCAG